MADGWQRVLGKVMLAVGSCLWRIGNVKRTSMSNILAVAWMEFS
jgi:hypothetical protein